MSDGLELVAALVNAAVEPVDDRVAARLGIVEVLHSNDVAAAGEIDLDGVVTAAERMPRDVAAVRCAAPDTAGEGFIDEGAVLLHDLVAFAAMTPVEPAVGMQEGAMHVSGIAGVVEAADDHLTLLCDAVVVAVSELPQSGRRADVEAAVQPARALRKGHLVGEDGAFVEDAVLVGVFEHENAVRRIRFELRLVPVHAHAIADEHTPTVIEAAHDRMRDERRSGGELQRVAGRQVVLWQSLRCLARQNERALTAFGNGVALVRRQVGGEDRNGEKEEQAAHDGSHTRRAGAQLACGRAKARTTNAALPALPGR